jgi:hypothetical protein
VHARDVSLQSQSGLGCEQDEPESITFTPDHPDQIAYQGHETFAFRRDEHEPNLRHHLENHVRVKGTDGTFVTVRAVAHLTVNPSGLIAAFDRPLLACS